MCLSFLWYWLCIINNIYFHRYQIWYNININNNDNNNNNNDNNNNNNKNNNNHNNKNNNGNDNDDNNDKSNNNNKNKNNHNNDNNNNNNDNNNSDKSNVGNSSKINDGNKFNKCGNETFKSASKLKIHDLTEDAAERSQVMFLHPSLRQKLWASECVWQLDIFQQECHVYCNFDTEKWSPNSPLDIRTFVH